MPDDWRKWPDDESSGSREDLGGSGWPRRSPKRFRAVILPASIALLGGVLMFVPSLGILGLPFLLGGSAAAIITFLLAAVSN